MRVDRKPESLDCGPRADAGALLGIEVRAIPAFTTRFFIREKFKRIKVVCQGIFERLEDRGGAERGLISNGNQGPKPGNIASRDRGLLPGRLWFREVTHA